MAAPPSRADVWALAASAVVVPVVWLGLGWRPGLLVSGYDAVAALLPMVETLVEGSGNPAALAWRPEILGGVALRDTLGPQPLLLGPAAWGLTSGDVLNFATFVTQVLFAFFGQRVVGDLAVVFGRSRPGWGWRLAGGVLLAFAPFVGWRVGYGHQTLLVGLLPFLCALVLVTARAANASSALLSGVAGVTVALSLPFVGQQIVLYGAVFGAPLLLGVWLASNRPARELAAPALVLVAGLCLSLPLYAPMVAHAFGGDALRELGGPTMTYSYLTASPWDWLTSLPWLRPAAGARIEIQLHESNLPLGPLLLLLALLPRGGRPILLGLATSIALTVAFASNLHPVSDLLLFLLPPLRSFRAPTRGLIPALAFLPLLVVAAFAGVASEREADVLSRRRGRQVAAGVAGVLALFLAPPWLREILGWTAAGLVVAMARGAAPDPRHAWLLVPLAASLVGGSLGAFRDRLLPFPEPEALLREAREEGERVRAQEPSLEAPLTRVALETEGRPLGANRAFAAGLASLDGYGFPQRRFVALVRSLRGEPYSPNALLLRFPEELAPSQVLFQLYNVAFALDDPGPTVRKLGPTAGAAWFPRELSRERDLAALSAALLAGGHEAHAEARRVLRVVDTDVATRGIAPAVPPGCAAAVVLDLDGTPSGLGVRVQTADSCPLVVAMNYAETLEAWGPQRLRTFPAYGALLGIEVPAGTLRVEIQPRSWPPSWTHPFAAAGAGLLVLLLRPR